MKTHLARLISTSVGILSATVLSSTIPAMAQNNSVQDGSTQNNPIQNDSSQQNEPNFASTESSFSIVDHQFITHAAQGDMTEIKTSQLALERSQNPQVRQFAQMMIDQHTQSSEQLKPLAERKGVALPEYLGADNQSLLLQLTKLSGAEFDQAYMSGQILAHATAQGLYRNEQLQGSDPDVKAFADQFFTIIASHYRMAAGMAAGH